MQEREAAYWTQLFQPGIDAAKHITTLNAGSIVVIGTFLKDIFPTKDGTLAVGPELKLLIAASFICFGISLLTATISIYVLTRNLQNYIFEPHDNPALQDQVLRYYVRQLHLPFFATGVICFGAAVLVNLY